mmetsp:Transcript_111398/g.325869  ORF Transcript_111398/g.325869 Transcript_111398/m.325869 type:complete len:247 (+) Transcript_111398:512-1252(+)
MHALRPMRAVGAAEADERAVPPLVTPVPQHALRSLLQGWPGAAWAHTPGAARRHADGTTKDVSHDLSLGTGRLTIQTLATWWCGRAGHRRRRRRWCGHRKATHQRRRARGGWLLLSAHNRVARHGIDTTLAGAAGLSTQELEVAALAPVVSPAVLHRPEGLAGLLAVAHEQNCVVDLLPLLVDPIRARAVDAVPVVHEVLLRLEGHDHGAAADQLLPDLFLSAATIKATHVVVVCGPVALLAKIAG